MTNFHRPADLNTTLITTHAACRVETDIHHFRSLFVSLIAANLAFAKHEWFIHIPNEWFMRLDAFHIGKLQKPTLRDGLITLCVAGATMFAASVVLYPAFDVSVYTYLGPLMEEYLIGPNSHIQLALVHGSDDCKYIWSYQCGHSKNKPFSPPPIIMQSTGGSTSKWN